MKKTDFEIMAEILQRSTENENGTIMIYEENHFIVIYQGYDASVEILFNDDGSIR